MFSSVESTCAESSHSNFRRSYVVPAMTKRTFASTSSALLVISSYTPFNSRSRTCIWEKNESVVATKALVRIDDGNILVKQKLQFSFRRIHSSFISLRMYQKLSDAYRNVRTISKYRSNGKIQITLISACALVLFLFGYLIAFAVHSHNHRNNFVPINDQSLEKDYRDYLISSIDRENIKSHLKFLTSFAHLAGTDGGKKSADYVYQTWKDQGLDDVQMIDYDVYLDVPNEEKLNKIEIVEQDGTKKLRNSITKPFLAYSQNGSVTASKLFYLNYCDRQDFEVIASKNISLNDSIVMCRYGWSFRANKVLNAQKYGAKGLILFDDPLRSSPKQAQNEVYPNGQFLPENGTQRGTLYMHDGDPLTPNYPSNNYTHRLREEQTGLPKIVCQVIGFRLARELFNIMDDHIPVPEFWNGELNVSYSIGGILKEKKQQN
ncbi:N-acetylated-alpha-linked acidic dipeptidase [Brachionus plicatilis]|uniref:N-acetylated-alpha-linked acidic dipeptidase n=1 Tax=Brachionus plicatilis TaxID=10195 RepID=A0A3M7QG14_BRAPC|nr:N-acetylated-alpha-linked acidic dipeptidase [Brachionus plicatilis]